MTAPLPSALAVLAATLVQAPSPSTPQEALQELAGQFISFHLYFNPVEATQLGEFGYGDRLPDVSREAFRARADAYARWLERLTSIDPGELTGDALADRSLLEAAIRARILDVRDIRAWERDPAFYVDLLDRAFVPLVRDGGLAPRTRMNHLTARLRQSATVLAEARQHLSAPPALFTRRAAEGAQGLVAFLRGEAAASFDSLAPGPGKDDFRRALDQAARELDRFAEFLRGDLLARSTGDVALGPERLRALLRHRELEDTDPERLLETLDERILADRDRLAAAVRRGPGSRRLADIVAELHVRRVPAAEARERASSFLGAVRTHLLRTLMLTLPSDRRPIVAVRDPRSPWERSRTTAPGPLASDDGPAELTLVGPPGSAGSGPTPPMLAATVLEEAFPGRFVETLYTRRAPTRVRKVVRPPSLAGGWALYAADALIAYDDELEGVPELLEVAVLARRLQALAETRAALMIHLGRQSLEAAAEALARDAYLPPATARESAEQAAHRPLERGVLGALELAALREEFVGTDADGRRAGWTVRRFHDAYLGSGLPPSLARAALLSAPGAEPDGAPGERRLNNPRDAGRNPRSPTTTASRPWGAPASSGSR